MDLQSFPQLEAELDESQIDNQELPVARTYHIAVRLGRDIVMFGGYIGLRAESFVPMLHVKLSHRVIWTYNVDFDLWTKHVTPESQTVPRGRINPCGAAIGRDIYMYGGLLFTEELNDMWKLSRTDKGKLKWTEVDFDRTFTPAPRNHNTAWDYDGKFWVFGGYGGPFEGYLNSHGEFLPADLPLKGGWNNQLLCFNPTSKQWQDVKCQGSVPSPRAGHATAKLQDKVWLFGGYAYERIDDLYELSMETLTWIRITIPGDLKPQARCHHSFTAIAPNLLLLHGGCGPYAISTLLLDVEAMSWRTHQVAEGARRMHTGTAGLDGSVVIIGGKTQFNESCTLTNKTLVVRLAPDSLLAQAARAVFRQGDRTRPEWESIPKNLYRLLENMYRENDAARRTVSLWCTTLCPVKHLQSRHDVFLNEV